MSISGIYEIRHKDTGRAYVGRSVNIRERWELHKRHTEQGRDRSPLHRALRKYGYEAFEWVVLVTAPARLHVALEECFIADRGTMVPRGYNVGGAAGGKPSRALLSAMEPAARETYLADMRAASQKMHKRIAELRADPAYEAWYRQCMSEAAKRRWANRKARMASDPEFAAEASRKGTERARKAAQTLRARKAADPAFARRVFEKQSAGAKETRARDPRTIFAKGR